jgi:hypothetical protein
MAVEELRRQKYDDPVSVWRTNPKKDVNEEVVVLLRRKWKKLVIL